MIYLKRNQLDDEVFDLFTLKKGYGPGTKRMPIVWATVHCDILDEFADQELLERLESHLALEITTNGTKIVDDYDMFMRPEMMKYTCPRCKTEVYSKDNEIVVSCPECACQSLDTERIIYDSNQ